MRTNLAAVFLFHKICIFSQFYWLREIIPLFIQYS
jgi:hypothetical protein